MTQQTNQESAKSHTPLPFSVNLYSAKYRVEDTDAPDFKEERKKRLIETGKDKFDAISIGTPHNQVCIVPLDESSMENANFIVQACNNYYEYHATMDMARTLLCKITEKKTPMTDEIYCVLEKLEKCLGIKWRKWDIAEMVADSEQIKKDHQTKGETHE